MIYIYFYKRNYDDTPGVKSVALNSVKSPKLTYVFFLFFFVSYLGGHKITGVINFIMKHKLKNLFNLLIVLSGSAYVPNFLLV
jgi:hypothetical protein